MIILIDGYNFIKSLSAHKFIQDSVIQSWIVDFQNYMKFRGNKIILIFDAGPFFLQTRDVLGGVEVIYAGHEKTADDVLKVWMQRNVGQDILLVTSDRQVRDYGSSLDIISISSQEFYKVFKSVMQQEKDVENSFTKTLYKTKTDDPQNCDELDQLMEQASRNLVADFVKSEYAEPVRIRESSKMSKADRQLMKKINKI